MADLAQKIIEEDLKQIVDDVGLEVLKKLEGKTVLVTGSNGLLGSYLVDNLAYLNDHFFENPCRIIGLSKSPVEKSGRLNHLQSRSDVKLLAHDVTLPLVVDEPIHFIIHSAGYSSPAAFVSDPLNTIDVNVGGVRWLLDLARKNPVEGFLYVSSGEIYGSPPSDQMPTPETYNGNVSPLAPRACYTESKRLAEAICLIYLKNYQVNVKVARPFLNYGPGLDINDKRVMTDFMKSAIEGRPISMQSPGLDKRCYCYISDGITALLKVLLLAKSGEVFNTANNLEEVTVLQMAQIVHELCGIREPVSAPSQTEGKFIKDAPTRVYPDITKIKTDLGFEPKVSFREGLKRTLNWNLARLGRPLLT